MIIGKLAEVGFKLVSFQRSTVICFWSDNNEGSIRHCSVVSVTMEVNVIVSMEIVT